jgi:hypothetical protein
MRCAGTECAWVDKTGTGKVQGHRHRMGDNIKMDFTDYNLRVWIYLCGSELDLVSDRCDYGNEPLA